MQMRTASNQTVKSQNKKDDDGSITVKYFQGQSFDIGQTIDLELLGNALHYFEIKCAQAFERFLPWFSCGLIYLVVDIHIIHW